MSEQNPIPGPAVIEAIENLNRSFPGSINFEKNVALLHIEKTIVKRIIEHQNNLYMWREGEICGCVRMGVARAACLMCNGFGKADVGALVPTEPDREERDAVRMRLVTAIEECDWLFSEIFGRPYKK